MKMIFVKVEGIHSKKLLRSLNYGSFVSNPYQMGRFKTQNYGISLGLFNELTLNFDYYIHRSRDILIKDYHLPSLQGVPYGRMAYENAGKCIIKGLN